MSVKNALILVLGVVLLNGCAEFDNDRDLNPRRTATEAETTACVLAFVNDPGTTRQLLDVDVALDRRAAENLVKHRDGADHRVMTRDDNVIGDLGELASISWVGDSAMNKIESYAVNNFCVPASSNAFNGLYEGIGFTQRQMEMSLTVINTATDQQLVGVLRNKEAAQAVLERREITSLDELIEVPGIERKELVGLRAASMRW